MIVVTGATGHLGRSVVDRLLSRLPAHQIAACVRDPAKASTLTDRGVHVRQGNFAEPEKLAAAFADADQVLLVSVDKLGEEGRRLHRAAIKAARAAGVGRVLYTSHMGTHPGSPFSDHHVAEAVLAEGGKPFTSLRHGFYAESALHMIGKGIEVGEIRAPEDGPVSWTARADLAEADAAILADPGRFDRITPPLTATEALTMGDMAELASELTGRAIKRITVTDQEWRDSTVARGVPAAMADLLLGVYRDARRGVFAAVDPTLGRLLGRSPLSMREVLNIHLGG